MIGATPQEAGAPGPDEVWGVGVAPGNESAGAVLVRYASGSGWTLGPALLDVAGQRLSSFKLEASPLAGQMTADGAGAMVGTVPVGAGAPPREVVLVRKPGGAFEQTAPLPEEGEASLREGEALLARRAPLLAPLDEAGGGAGVLVVPVSGGKGVESRVLHWDGTRWNSETIAIPENSREDFRVLAIGASSPSNAWLLAQLSTSGSYPTGSVALFRRVPLSGENAGFTWKPVALGGPADAEAHPLTVPVAEGSPPLFTVPGTGEPPTVQSQIITVTSQGVWIDGERSDAGASATLFFKPREESAGEHAAEGELSSSWCVAGGTPACQHELPEALPKGPSRSIAWASGSGFGERVITGMQEGVSLRLEGQTFERVLSLGAGKGAREDAGAQFGAAFATAKEGWLGLSRLPIHLTLEPASSRVSPWPVPFRHALTAVAPQPGAPVGSLSSEALVVGDQGEVARYKPGAGWLPESLFGPGQRVQTPRLRAVAWPTPMRAYAVGDHGEMWLWRGEIGLWERDPATPVNFRGNLLGVAFDPTNPARGYAVGSPEVGSSGALLRYGKTWVQEEALPPQVQGASFTAIVFAGSQAIVAYRKQPNPARNEFVGGLLLNDGSGWRVDDGAAAAIGAGIPEGLAALPDGGAAFVTSGSQGTRVFERESAGAPWQPVPTPLPRAGAGSLALFREGGALRAIAASGGAGSVAENEPPPPPGFAPNEVPPLPLGASGNESSVLRQTASGWSDETHELNPLGEPEGLYVNWDMPHRQEPVLGVLVDAGGTQGWAVGGEVNAEPRLQTASIERYPADGAAPPGVGSSSVPLESGAATFAIGGGAQCATPCASRALAGIGPDVWLSSALQRAGQIGVRAFLYTGPRLTTGETSTKEPPVIPYGQELGRYAELLASSPVPPYPAASPQDLNARPLGLGQGSEVTFTSAFAGFPEPLGGLGGIGKGERQACAEAAGCEASYYAFDSPGVGGTVRVVVLDDSAGGDVSAQQLSWLEGELSSAAASGLPAIVVGNADLDAQVRAGDAQAGRVVQVLVNGGECHCGASAYFYDSPQENVTKPLRAGRESIPSFGSGTLGYVEVIRERHGDFNGASGFLLGQVDAAHRVPGTPVTNRAPVTARLIPNIGELALEAKDGILLRRSEPALFDALARRPHAGNRSALGSNEQPEVDPYIPIPANCVGTACQSTALLPEYTFSSSRPDIGDFVKPNLASSENHAVEQGPDGKPIHDPQSGLFCAYNAGTTIVTISAGGLSSALPVTIQPGSVRQPCGTTPLKELPPLSQQASVAPPPAPAPAPTGAAPASTPPPVPLPPAPPPAPPAPVSPSAPAHVLAPFIPLVAPVTPTLAFVPLPVPTPARPTPPSGTSAVTSPVEVAEHEEEEEEATESVSNQAVAYRASEQEPIPTYLLGIVALAALAGASARRRPRRGRREVRVAPATLTGMRAQRQMSRGSRRRAP
jgi:hypothetical protein